MLVPAHARRYLPAGRRGVGHPVLSMWQTDIICYGLDPADYMDQPSDLNACAPEQGRGPFAIKRMGL